MVAQCLSTMLMLVSMHWFILLLNLPVAAWNIYRYAHPVSASVGPPHVHVGDPFSFVVVPFMSCGWKNKAAMIGPHPRGFLGSEGKNPNI